MKYHNAVIRNRSNPRTKDERMFFVIETELKNDLREIEQANFISESQFIRESARRNITAYKKASL